MGDDFDMDQIITPRSLKSVADILAEHGGGDSSSTLMSLQSALRDEGDTDTASSDFDSPLPSESTLSKTVSPKTHKARVKKSRLGASEENPPTFKMEQNASIENAKTNAARYNFKIPIKPKDEERPKPSPEEEETSPDGKKVQYNFKIKGRTEKSSQFLEEANADIVPTTPTEKKEPGKKKSSSKKTSKHASVEAQAKAVEDKKLKLSELLLSLKKMKTQLETKTKEQEDQTEEYKVKLNKLNEELRKKDEEVKRLKEENQALNQRITRDATDKTMMIAELMRMREVEEARAQAEGRANAAEEKRRKREQEMKELEEEEKEEERRVAEAKHKREERRRKLLEDEEPGDPTTGEESEPVYKKNSRREARRKLLEAEIQKEEELKQMVVAEMQKRGKTVEPSPTKSIISSPNRHRRNRSTGSVIRDGRSNDRLKTERDLKGD